jgi:hypothetical protein
MAKEKFIKVMRLNADGLPEIEIIENDLKSFQKIVGGYIEVVEFYFEGGKVLCILNEEGKLEGLKPNFAFEIHKDETKRYMDIIVGDVVFVGEDGPEFRGLTGEELREALRVTQDGRVDLMIMGLERNLEELY